MWAGGTKMMGVRSSRILRTIGLLIAIWCCGSWAANVEVLDQELNVNGQGYTVLRVWGSYYEMGWAHASVLGDYIVEAINQTKAKLGGNYAATRNRIAASVWLPLESEAELDGMVDCLNVTHPAAAIDKLDLKVFNTVGDWLYSCRSHTCWGRYMAAPVNTLSTRRLDFSTALPILNHHVLIAYDPNDASPEWLNLAWPGIVTVAQGINEYGTLVSLHDFQSFPADLSAGRMSRLVAARYAITYITSDDLSTQLEDVFAELQNYEIMTGGFINYYAPLGFGGVINCSPNAVGPDFYRLRTPQAVWHHGEAMVTTNRDTNGTYTPSDEDFGVDAYYNDESPKTHESHWHLLDPVAANHALSRLSVAYRGRRDMTVWADGRLDGIGRTPRLEYEWSELFDTNIKYGGGSGEPNDPYQIATAADLIALGETPEDYDKHFILTADIDLAGHVFDKALIACDTGPAEPYYQGPPFAGIFDGNGHTISHLAITGEDWVGLFGRLGSAAIIQNLGLQGVEVNGTNFVGALVGHNLGQIIATHSSGSVSGDGPVGGLVGHNHGRITGSYNTGTVNGSSLVGGLVGSNFDIITTSYSTGTVTGGYAVGGLVGENIKSGDVGADGSITSSYSTGTVSGPDQATGGLVGGPRPSGHTPTTLGSTATSFWDIQTSGQAASSGGEGKTTAEMKTASTFLDAGWDFVDVWSICEGTNYPRFVWQIPVGDFVCPDGVTMLDFSLFAKHWLDDNCDVSNGYCQATDLDLSGGVQIDDLEAFADNWLSGTAP
jgi:hypothetical protein